MKVRNRKLRRSVSRQRLRRRHQGRKNADCLWSLFSMCHRLVRQVFFAVDFRETFGRVVIPMRSPTPVCIDKSACVYQKSLCSNRTRVAISDNFIVRRMLVCPRNNGMIKFVFNDSASTSQEFGRRDLAIRSESTVHDCFKG